MPRRTRPRKRRGRGPASEQEREPLHAPETIAAAPEGWQVRLVQPASATKEYRCPGCNQEIRVSTKHVVAWREGHESERRHWHLRCWELRRRRR